MVVVLPGSSGVLAKDYPSDIGVVCIKFMLGWLAADGKS